jgi:cell shape-determining protein MreC
VALLPEFASEISSVFQLFLILIAVATAGYALKVKFIQAAQKYTKEIEKKIFEYNDDNSIIRQIAFHKKRIEDLENRINSNEKEITRLDERSKHDHE